MTFSSLHFIFLFLPFTVGIYFLVRSDRWKNLWLLVTSLIFYSFGDPTFLPTLLLLIAFNFYAAILVEEPRVSSLRPWILGIGIAANLLVLFFFKYLNFAIEIIHTSFLGQSFSEDWRNRQIILPLGISFFTFHAISYLIDVYRGKSKSRRNPIDLGLYFTFFPQLVAGPIIRFCDIESDLSFRKVRMSEFLSGLDRFSWGLAKKCILANQLGRVADGVFAIEHASFSSAWIGAGAYSLQIYFDFSGYSDMALGLAKLFGFNFRENFRFPYLARSFTEFWRSWHISLSTWFRDYLYIPLGGNRNGLGRTYANLFLVFLLCGLWHGAQWTFVTWGLFHGAFLMLERTSQFRHHFQNHPSVFRVYVWLFVVLGWVIFRADDLGHVQSMYSSMLGLTPAGEDFFVSLQMKCLILLAAFVATVGEPWLFKEFFEANLNKGRALLKNICFRTAMLTLLLASVAELVLGTHNPFIYYRF
jgi:alginate O-acetyltransferase complex protein AlgI